MTTYHHEPRITRNIAKCNACGDVVESTYRHDWRQCRCGEFYVDGGLAYLRRGYGEKGYTEMSEYALGDPTP